MKLRGTLLGGCIALLLWMIPSLGHAQQLFDLPQFLEKNQIAVGLEPELRLSGQDGGSLRVRFKHGFTDQLNLGGFIGSGTQERKFSLGAFSLLEVFPDYENQPGFGIPAHAIYTKRSGGGELVFTVSPMIYKTFQGAQKMGVTPFLGVTAGWMIYDVDSFSIARLHAGVDFSPMPKSPLHFIFELGINLSHSYTGLSGGVSYSF